MSSHSLEQHDDPNALVFACCAIVTAGRDGWLDIEEFNVMLAFDKYKKTDNQLGLCFDEFKHMVL